MMSVSLIVLAFLFIKSQIGSANPTPFEGSRPSLELATGTITPYNLTAPDGSIKATFLNYGATLQQLWVKDKTGKFRDVVLGFDDLVCSFTYGLICRDMLKTPCD
jgi:hypothetical protein